MARGGDMHTIILAYWVQCKKDKKGNKMQGQKMQYKWLQQKRIGGGLEQQIAGAKNVIQMIATKEDWKNYINGGRVA